MYRFRLLSLFITLCIISLTFSGANPANASEEGVISSVAETGYEEENEEQGDDIDDIADAKSTFIKIMGTNNSTGCLLNITHLRSIPSEHLGPLRGLIEEGRENPQSFENSYVLDDLNHTDVLWLKGAWEALGEARAQEAQGEQEAQTFYSYLKESVREHSQHLTPPVEFLDKLITLKIITEAQAWLFTSSDPADSKSKDKRISLESLISEATWTRNDVKYDLRPNSSSYIADYHRRESYSRDIPYLVKMINREKSCAHNIERFLERLDEWVTLKFISEETRQKIINTPQFNKKRRIHPRYGKLPSMLGYADRTPLIASVEKGHLRHVKLLLDASALDSRKEVLLMAIEKNNIAIFRALLSHDVNHHPDRPPIYSDYTDALTMIVENNQSDFLKMILEHSSAQEQIISSELYTKLLNQAFSRNHFDCLETLFRDEERLNSCEKGNIISSFLQRAARLKRAGKAFPANLFALMLRSHPALENTDINTAHHVDLSTDSKSKNHQINIFTLYNNLISGKGLNNAAKQGDTEKVQSLLQLGSHNDRYFFTYALDSKNSELIHTALKHVVTQIKNQNLSSPSPFITCEDLMRTIAHHPTKAEFRHLLSKVSYYNKKIDSYNNRTLLMESLLQHQWRYALALLEHPDIDLTVKDNEGLTAIDHASRIRDQHNTSDIQVPQIQQLQFIIETMERQETPLPCGHSCTIM